MATNPKQAGDREPTLHLFDPEAVQRALKAVENLPKHNERRVTAEQSLKRFADAFVDDMDIGTVPLAVVSNDLEQDLPRLRSEEHTSELQSLMRISYAVFSSQKKTTTNMYS